MTGSSVIPPIVVPFLNVAMFFGSFNNMLFTLPPLHYKKAFFNTEISVINAIFLVVIIVIVIIVIPHIVSFSLEYRGS